MTKQLIRSILAALLVTSTFQSLAKEQAFKICADPVNPPVSNKAGKGYENEIAKLFAEQLQQPLEYTWFPQRIGFIRNTLKAYQPETEDFKCDIVMGVPTGYELTSTTKTYFRSTYVLIYPKNKGWDNIKKADDIMQLDQSQLEKLRIAMFDRGPGTTWIHNHGLIDQGIPYQTMTGDGSFNTAMTMDQEFAKDNIDMAILWGPTAAYVYSINPDKFVMTPMQSKATMKFDFPISMGVRRKDKELLNQLNQLIDNNQDKITEILRSHNIPLVDEKGQLL
ncbi:MAG: quinoprotein dehydrogenase-associated putative ABC transporter substrate-binding protein [Methylococcales bacterium]